MTLPAAVFVFGVIWLVTFAFGLVVELVAQRFMSDGAARFGAFCFVAGLIIGGRATIFRDFSDAQTIASSAASIVALLCLGWRAFGDRFRRQGTH